MSRVFLLGYRASGKTTAGRLLAERLGVPFVDIDTAVCARFGGRTVAEIWAAEGEPRFREVEVEVTASLCGAGARVVALGGGTLMQPGARAAVAGDPGALRVYLRAEPEVLHERIEGDAASAGLRPALTARGGGIEEIRAVLAEREPVYEAVADAVLDVDACAVEAIVARIAALAGRGRGGTGEA